MIAKFGAFIAILFIAGCATDPAVLASRKLDGETLTSHAWIAAIKTFNNIGHSGETEGFCKFSADGTGFLSSRRFGYTRPGDKFLSATGCGAYTEVISWPISWEALGNGEIELECSDEPTSTGPNYGTQKPLALASAKLSGKTLVLMYSNGASTTYQSTNPNDSRLNLTESEISRRLASWASKGPQMLAIGMNQEANENGDSMITIIKGSGGEVIYAKRNTYPKPKK